MHHLTGSGWAIIAIGAFLAQTVFFILFWMVTGWGVSIAVRSYRWCMRKRSYPGYHAELLGSLDAPSHLNSR
jgi:hypothetical protein